MLKQFEKLVRKRVKSEQKEAERIVLNEASNASIDLHGHRNRANSVDELLEKLGLVQWVQAEF